jgi:hypothetical protein
MTTFCFFFFSTCIYVIHKDDFAVFSYSYVVCTCTSLCFFFSSPFLCFVSILSFHTTLPRLKCDCEISLKRRVYSATGCPQDTRLGAECFRKEEDKGNSRMHTYFLPAYVRIEDIDVSDFESSVCITDRYLQFQFLS